VWRSRCSASRAQLSSSAASLRAETQSSCTARDSEPAATAGASSTITWAFVPPMPNELTPARRGSASVIQGRSSVLTKNGLESKSISGFGRS